MEFGIHFSDESNDGDIFLDEIPFQIETERKSKKRKEDEISSSPTLPSDTTSMSFPEKILGQQIKQKTQTNIVSKKTSVYISAVMEGIAKFVLGKAGEEKDHYILPENRCIRVDDVEKVLSTVGVPDIESDLVSREYLCGKTICIDSINDSILEQTQSILSSIIKEYIDVSVLSINPSPLLQDYIVQQLQTPDGILLTTYCERVETALQFQSKTKQCLIIPRSLRLLLSVCIAQGKQRQQGLLFLKNYLNSFHDRITFTADIYIDVDDNTKYYKEYNQYRRDLVSNHDCQKPSLQYYKLEIEQLVFYKIIRDIMKGKWIITIPRYCHPESWEFEQILRIASGRVETFQKCSIQLEFDIKSLNTRGKIVYTDAVSIMKKFNSLKKFQYPSLWNDDPCNEKNQTVLCNLGLLCLCPMEVIPVIYHHLYYQCQIVLFSSLSEDHLSIRSILELIRGGII